MCKETKIGEIMIEITTTITYKKPELSDFENNQNIKQYIIDHKKDFDEDEDFASEGMYDELDYRFDSSFNVIDPNNLFSDYDYEECYDSFSIRYREDMCSIFKELYHRMYSPAKNIETE